MPVKSIKK